MVYKKCAFHNLGITRITGQTNPTPSDLNRLPIWRLINDRFFTCSSFHACGRN